MTVTDTTTIDKESYEYELFLPSLVFGTRFTPSHERETYLQENARDGVQLLVSALFSLPTLSSPEGPLAQLPSPMTQLPRAKPLPKPKPPTKWERFARAKGIQSRQRDRKTWDEEGQAWVARWGWKGKNKAEESQWLHEVPANAGASYSTYHILPIFFVFSLHLPHILFLEGKSTENFCALNVRCGF